MPVTRSPSPAPFQSESIPLEVNLDRLLHHSTVVQISGESNRLKDKRRAGLVARPKQKG